MTRSRWLEREVATPRIHSGSQGPLCRIRKIPAHQPRFLVDLYTGIIGRVEEVQVCNHEATNGGA